MQAIIYRDGSFFYTKKGATHDYHQQLPHPTSEEL